jgi:hypothetical protein
MVGFDGQPSKWEPSRQKLVRFYQVAPVLNGEIESITEGLSQYSAGWIYDLIWEGPGSSRRTFITPSAEEYLALARWTQRPLTGSKTAVAVVERERIELLEKVRVETLRETRRVSHRTPQHWRLLQQQAAAITGQHQGPTVSEPGPALALAG